MGLNKLVNTYIIRNSDIEALVSYNDDASFKDVTKRTLSNIKFGLIFTVSLDLLAMVVYSFLVVDIGFRVLSVAVLVFVTIIFVLFHVLAWTFGNRYIFYESSFLVTGILNNWLAYLSKFFDSANMKWINELNSNVSTYHLTLVNIFSSLFQLIIVVIMVLVSNVSIGLKFVGLLLGALLIFIMSVFGYNWTLVRNQVTNRSRNLEKLPKHLMFRRVAYPMVTNTVGNVVLPLVLLCLVRFGVNQLIVQASLLAGIVSYSWTLVEALHKFELAKTALVNINAYVADIDSKYIINNKGFHKLAEMCRPSTQVLQKSLENKSFIIKDFVPMSITNGDIPTHIFNFEFKPGIYQLNGVNGIGKTTFLESLTLPDSIRVEYSRGELALHGQPFFDNTQDIVSHRKKYIYIGTNAAQVEPSDQNVHVFSSFPTIQDFLQTTKKENHEKHSEGEKSVLLICDAFQKALTNGVKLIFIDEAISRIYDSEGLPLRTEVIALIKELSMKQDIVVIVVDHMTKLPYATQLHMDKKLISIL